MPVLAKYGEDYGYEFTKDDQFKGKKRWVREVDIFRKELEKFPEKHTVDISKASNGQIQIRVLNLDDGKLKSSMDLSDYPLVLNIEISMRYPLEPPFVWIQSPIIGGLDEVGVFKGVPCIEQLHMSGWSPVWSLTSVFSFVMNALSENTVLCSYATEKEVKRNDALEGARFISNNHKEWDK